jgi:protein TonB
VQPADEGADPAQAPLPPRTPDTPPVDAAPEPDPRPRQTDTPAAQQTPVAAPETPAADAPQPATASAEGGDAPPSAVAADAAGPGLSAGDSAALLDSYSARVRAEIESHKTYPSLARQRGQEGVVQLDLTIARDGTRQALAVRSSSGYRLLDDAALDAALRVGTYPPAPDTLDGESFRFQFSMGFTLN